MKYSGTLTVTTFQVGDTVYFVENDLPVSSTVMATENIVTSGGETIRYQLDGYGNKWFLESELFETVELLKTGFETLADEL